MLKVSVIMPVYNGEEFLDDSIQSVLNQTFSDFELICVDDASVDESCAIIHKYLKLDKRIRYFFKTNEGPGVALNYGVDRAVGEYICFLDQDDKYHENYLSLMVASIEQNDLQLSFCNAYFWRKNFLSRIPYPSASESILDITKKDNKALFSGHYFPQWTKIVRRKFWVENKITFPGRENKAHDVPVHYELLSIVDNVGYVENCIYFHRVHSNQISYNFDSGFFYMLSIRNIIDWASTVKLNAERRFELSQFLKFLFLHSASAAKNDQTLNSLFLLVRSIFDVSQHNEVGKITTENSFLKFVKNFSYFNLLKYKLLSCVTFGSIKKRYKKKYNKQKSLFLIKKQFNSK